MGLKFFLHGASVNEVLVQEFARAAKYNLISKYEGIVYYNCIWTFVINAEESTYSPLSSPRSSENGDKNRNKR